MLLFGILLSSEDENGLFELSEMWNLVRECVPPLQKLVKYSTVAARDVKVISIMLDYDAKIQRSEWKRLQIVDVVARVLQWEGIERNVGPEGYPGIPEIGIEEVDIISSESLKEMLAYIGNELDIARGPRDF
ncbi:hypothetical protein VE01_09913 [Pseudogymnoascus verrucosus]|uniref:Uncharacterized protein n=1 Tax=Pseudogymnoascus verrucosus TaxID=342668 RepID=A0A1B8G7Z7_9PEZI|nr:uncharacterized protein VE01_09913 [Pseudogymnoascus verrucosus]OBT91958.1 hypothetical protein VE01_09913 [Pseudogymnoascus verrucosus]